MDPATFHSSDGKTLRLADAGFCHNLGWLPLLQRKCDVVFSVDASMHALKGDSFDPSYELDRARRAAERLFGKGGKRRQAAAAELSDDDDAPEFGRRFGEVALDAASRAIAVYWLRSARANLQNQGDAGKPAVKRKRPKKGEGREAKSRKAKK